MQSPQHDVAEFPPVEEPTAWRFKDKYLPIPLRIAGTYFIFSLVWIFASDSLVWIEMEDRHRFLASTIKGTLFVVLTTTLIYWLSRREMLRTSADIEELKRADVALRSSEATLRLFLEFAPAPIAMFDRDMRYLHVSRRWMSDYRLDMNDLIGKSHYDIFPNLQERWKEVHQRCLAGQVELCDEDRFVRQDGTIQWIRWEVRPWFQTAGEIGGIILFTEDITDRKRDEQSREESVRQLQISEQRFRHLADAIPQMVWTCDRDGQASHINLTAADYIGVPPEEFLHWESTLHPDDLSQTVELWQKTLRTGDPFYNEARFRRANGEFRWHIVRAVPVRDASGAITEWYGTCTEVEVLKRIEQTLRERERFLRIVTATARVGMIVMNESYEILFANEAYAEFLDLEPDQILGRRVPDVNPGEWSQIKPNLDRALSGERVEFEVQLPPLSGGSTPRWNRAISQPMIDEAGRATTVTVVMDITELKQTRLNISESEERYRRLVDVLPDALMVHNGEEVVFCNPAFVRLVGATSPNEVLGKNAFEFIHKDYHDIVRKRRQSSRETGSSVPGMEMLALRRDGKTVPVYVVGSTISGYGDTASLVALSDLTERERSVDLLRSVMESVGDAILTIDERGNVRSANSAAERLFGFSLSEILNSNVNLLMPEPYRSEHDEYIANFLRTGTPKVIGTVREFEARRKDGTTFPIEITITEFRLDGERHFTGVMRDISGRKRLETQFQQSQKMEAIGRLAGGVAHDFNNLLTVINGYANLMLTESPKDPPQRESILAILDAGERAANLTGQLLAFSRKSVVEPQTSDLNEIIENSVSMLRRLIEENIHLTVVPCPTVALIKAAPGQIEQVIVNLAVNARDAMPSGGRLIIETRKITLTNDDRGRFPELDPGQHVQLSFTDSGHGMTDSVKHKIFEPFFTTKAIGKGTGLGLSVVLGIVQQCGGSVTVESQIDLGTTFTVMLPLAQQNENLAESQTPRRPSEGHETILLVEDELAVRRIARIALQANGYQVLEAGGGDEAIRLADQFLETIDLLLTDVVMPEIGGLKVAETLRQRRPGLRVLFMTGYTDDSVIPRGIAETHDALLQKPFTAVALARKVRTVLDALN